LCVREFYSALKSVVGAAPHKSLRNTNNSTPLFVAFLQIVYKPTQIRHRKIFYAVVGVAPSFAAWPHQQANWGKTTWRTYTQLVFS